MAKKTISEAEALRIQAVKDKIESARLKRLTDGVIETPEETVARIALEKEELEGIILVEDTTHTVARDTRVATVKSNIEAAAQKREKDALGGVRETEGATLDRLAKEAKDLKEASVLNVIESVGVDGNGVSEVTKLANKVNEIIIFLNKKYGSKVEIKETK